MQVCPKCGRRSKGAEFCPHCGTPFEHPMAGGQPPAQPAPQAPKQGGTPLLTYALAGVLVMAALIFIFVLGGIGFVVLLLQSGTPTTMQISAPAHADVNSTIPISATLMDSMGNPVPGKTITFDYGNHATAVTNSNGVARASIVLNQIGTWQIVARFAGDTAYLSSLTARNVSITPPSCYDGTVVGGCNGNGFYCSENRSLAYDCAACGCSGNRVCYDNYCMSDEERTGFLIDDLQESMVYVAHTYATGSGVIIAQDGTHTFVLTNRHVVADADRISDVHVTLRDQQTIPASDILVAPFGMDLAIIALLGTYGEPVSVNISTPIYQGQAVMALGSPLGLQGSVSNGIVSNVIYDYTDSDYRYIALQTDAAINPGNSGGGLFLKSTGTLIGINTFVLPSEYGAEGLGFAIDVRSIDELPAPDQWQGFVPTPKCSDGTPYNSCSVNTPGKYCSGGRLRDDCTRCGCAAGYSCPGNGVCFICRPGYSAWQTPEGRGFCCPNGRVGYDDGTCS
ncbi:MAG: trypsin-like peptidase domain-containing protein [Candidatus ainarchaeum sp.]|nr:trypsin-like peptidase domain-containing protein [Candidatus ainarchaeum sp.]MDD5096007.1 trypsin-like peptidase domain-containing protein [Candidatus ainarchaeum sp.]